MSRLTNNSQQFSCPHKHSSLIETSQGKSHKKIKILRPIPFWINTQLNKNNSRATIFERILESMEKQKVMIVYRKKIKTVVLKIDI